MEYKLVPQDLEQLEPTRESLEHWNDIVDKASKASILENDTSCYCITTHTSDGIIKLGSINYSAIHCSLCAFNMNLCHICILHKLGYSCTNYISWRAVKNAHTTKEIINAVVRMRDTIKDTYNALLTYQSNILIEKCAKPKEKPDTLKLLYDNFEPVTITFNDPINMLAVGSMYGNSSYHSRVNTAIQLLINDNIVIKGDFDSRHITENKNDHSYAMLYKERNKICDKIKVKQSE